MTPSERIEFVDSIYNSGLEAIKENIKKEQQKSNQQVKFRKPIEELGTYESVNRRIKYAVNVLKQCFNPQLSEDSKIYDINTELLSDAQNDLEKIFEAHKYESNFRTGLKKMLQDMRSLLVDILRDRDMLSVAHGALFKTVDIEKDLEKIIHEA